MKKAKGKGSYPKPEQALTFLEEIKSLQSGIDSPTKAISLRVPDNILKAYKARAEIEKRPYQSMMIQALREFLFIQKL